jgi:aldehyde:ferredoxin oxidoreductase
MAEERFLVTGAPGCIGAWVVRVLVREGADDTLPPRLLTQPRPSGGAAGSLPDLQPMLEAYYRLRGWDAE